MDRYKPILLGTGILAVFVFGAVGLVALSPDPPRTSPPPQAPLVTTEPVSVQTGSLPVRGSGTVQPARQVTLSAEVSGRIVEVSDAFVSGGHVQEGGILARIDSTNYASSVQQAEAGLTEARYQLIQAREAQGIAREEYRFLQSHTGRDVSPDSSALGRLVFKEPEVNRAEASVASARAQLRTARVNLDRTVIRAPYSGVVREKQIEVGSYVGPGTPLGTMFGTDRVEVAVSLSSRQADLIDGLWRLRTDRRRVDVPATVITELGARTYAWDGAVDRVEAAKDSQTRTVDLVVRVPDPYRRGPNAVDSASHGEGAESLAPLQVGTFVDVRIEGRQRTQFATVPRRALRYGDTDDQAMVWTVVGDTMLVERSVEVIQTVDNVAYLSPSLDDGVPVMTTNLDIQVDSMRVRTPSGG